MEPLQLLGPLDALGPYVEYIILVLVLVNFVTRRVAHGRHVRQADASEDAEEVTRSTFHEVTNVLLLLSSFYYASVEPHGGTVMSVLVIGLVITDFFEFEARKVEARKGDPLDAPNGAITAAVLVLLYAAYQALFHLIEGPFSAIV
ncbi:hypothetical protein BRC81_12840 [Halobacteriales archaeon QS_1_68_20]|nr:MAG: hypothetical protein BRC81_12840 [Halobacteriales archaeon QS_1_68_20]